MKIWDTIVVGGGVIGLSLARELNAKGQRVLVVERAEPGREASYAAAGMIASCDPHLLPAMQPLASASAQMYPEWVRELEEETHAHVDFRTEGVIAFFGDEVPQFPFGEGGSRTRKLSESELAVIEPNVASRPGAYLLPENWLDPRSLLASLLTSLKSREIDMVRGSVVLEVRVAEGRAVGVRTDKSEYAANNVVNCAGAWAGQIPQINFPTRPLKGQMLSLVFPHVTPGSDELPPLLRHVVRADELCYIVPRSDGRYIVGSTVEEAGFDKHVVPDVIQQLHQSAALLVPQLGEARILEAWSGLRPGTPDDLPLIGETEIKNYFAACGHFRDGIMLAPITAKLVAQLVLGEEPELDLQAFAPGRSY